MAFRDTSRAGKYSKLDGLVLVTYGQINMSVDTTRWPSLNSDNFVEAYIRTRLTTCFNCLTNDSYVCTYTYCTIWIHKQLTSVITRGTLIIVSLFWLAQLRWRHVLPDYVKTRLRQYQFIRLIFGMDFTSVDPPRVRTPVFVGSLSTWSNEGKYVIFVCLFVCPCV